MIVLECKPSQYQSDQQFFDDHSIVIWKELINSIHSSVLNGDKRETVPVIDIRFVDDRGEEIDRQTFDTVRDDYRFTLNSIKDQLLVEENYELMSEFGSKIEEALSELDSFEKKIK